MTRHDRARAQCKGGSDARWSLEMQFEDRVYTVRGKRIKVQPRRVRYEPDQSRNKYTGMDLRAIRALRGVGRPVKFKLEMRYG